MKGNSPNNQGIGSSELPPGPLLVKAGATGAGARTVWPGANPNDVIEHRHVMKFSTEFSEKAAAERLASDPRRQALPAGPMQVEAIKPGIFRVPYKIGDRFTLQNAQHEFSFNWMRPASGEEESLTDNSGPGTEAVL